MTSSCNCLGTRLYGSLTGTLSITSISISKSLMSPMSLTLQEKTSFWQVNISFTIICLVVDKWLKSKFGVQSKFSELSFFFTFVSGSVMCNVFLLLSKGITIDTLYVIVFHSWSSKVQSSGYKLSRLCRVSCPF